MLALRDGNTHAVQRDAFLAPHRHIFQFNEGNQLSILIANGEQTVRAAVIARYGWRVSVALPAGPL